MHTDSRYIARRHTDNLTQSGANILADKIRLYWLQQGKIPDVTVERDGFKARDRDQPLGDNSIYVIRSDMLNGWPV